MGAPAELRGLHALGQEALDRPGVDEHVHPLRRPRALGVALGDMDALDAELHGESAPVLTGRRLSAGDPKVARNIEQCLA